MNGVVYDKFHRVLDSDLRVSLEVTLAPNIQYRICHQVPHGNRPKLMYRNNFFQRFYHPARLAGNIIQDESASIEFVPWIDADEVQYYRLGFWAQSAGAKDFWLQFGRFGEERSFGFGNPERPYHLNLDFISTNKPVFQPLYAKARIRNKENPEPGEVISFVLEGGIDEGDGKAVLCLKRVKKQELPPVLANLFP